MAVQNLKIAPEVEMRSNFSKEVRKLKTAAEEELRSYGVSALFTSVLRVDRALVIIKDRLANDVTLKNRTPRLPEEITKLLKLCLKCTYCSFQDQYYLQIHGAAMGSLV